MTGLEGKVAVITGGAGGIGLAIARKFAASGAFVAVTSRDRTRAEAVAAELSAFGGRALGFPFALEDPECGRSLIEGVVEAFRGIDILVNNAVSHGTLPPVRMEALTPESVSAGVTANLSCVLSLTALAYPYLRASGGSVLNIGSAVVNRHMSGIPLYAILKGALTQATRTLAAEWARDGVRVNQINPGMVPSEAHRNIGIPEQMLPVLFAHYGASHPLRGIGKAEDIASAALFLSSGGSGWTTGAVLEVDGGYSVGGVDGLA